MNRSSLAPVCLCVLAAAGTCESLAAQGPLAALPSKPGPHIDEIKALGDNQWLNLGSPAADPAWGKARGRSWSSNMPAAPDLRGAFVFGEGVHAYVKPDGRYMNDVWFYDVNAHRWVCLYPGIEVQTIAERIKNKELTVNVDGLMVDRNGEPLPPLLIHAYGNLGYDPERKKFVFFGRQFGNYFTWGKGAAFEEANELFKAERQSKEYPPHSPFFYDVASGKFECFPVARAPKSGGGFGANVLVYVGSKKQFFFGGSDGVWFFDMPRRTWEKAEATGTPPAGIDHCAAYDGKRDCIYYQHRDGKTAAENFLVYDVKENSWSKPRPQGVGPFFSSAYESIFNFDAAHDRLVIIRHRTTKDEPGFRQGVYAYDPQSNAWADSLPLPPDAAEGIRGSTYGFYDPELNAYFCHAAGDSRDDGSMWVYRYKK